MAEPNLLLSKIEAGGLWAYFHKDWLLEIRQTLRPQLPAGYHVFVESETVLVLPDATLAPAAILPDVAVARADVDPAAAQRSPRLGTAAVIEMDEPYEVLSKYSLVIRRAPQNAVVAALELLSPSNKGLGNRFDRDKYLRKRDNLLDAEVNFLEIDALVEGMRALPPALQNLAQFERNAWAASHRGGRRRVSGWGWNEDDPLPEIPWNVKEDLTVLVDLPATFGAACEFNQWENLVTSD
ncbi:MAG: DUF4058 family protein [Pirellulaceae bacterium]